jgi:two-component system NtrC family sensor kinase
MQVFLNLLINAKDAICRSGKINIESYCIDNNIYLKFTDTGCGIKEEHFERIFEPFFTTKGSLGGGPVASIGSGMGLSESYNIMKEHGGSIEIERSEVGVGTTFVIKLPLCTEENSEKISDE